jgi:hypothetical protein
MRNLSVIVFDPVSIPQARSRPGFPRTIPKARILSAKWGAISRATVAQAKSLSIVTGDPFKTRPTEL